jgi:hypothetical protein
LVPIPFEPHLRFGQCLYKRFQVFNNVRHEGVFGLVRAYDLVANRPVHLFSLARELFRDFPQARGQLHFQAAEMEQLRSPLLLQILLAGETKDLFFFVEEHPKGESLAQVLRARRRRRHPFTDQDALGLCWLLCQALESVQRFTVHGFLHPLDIYLEPWPDGPIPFYPKVAHIGIRTMLRAVGMPLEGLEEEAACYASPEFIAYRPLQKQVDVYGIGAVLYALLTLRCPTGCFVRPSSLRPGLPRTLDRILLRSLDEDPDERYPTPSALASALEEAWGFGTRRHEMETAVSRLCAAGAREAREALEPCRPRSRAGPLGGGGESEDRGRAGSGTLSLFSSDRVRAVCLVLLMLLNLGLFCQAAMEAVSSSGRGLNDSNGYRNWESLFLDLDGSRE